LWTVWIITVWNKAELKKMFVDNDTRIKERELWIIQNQKLSQILMNKALDFCDNSWIKETFLSTSNPFAVKFYLKNWFKQISENKNPVYMKRCITWIHEK
jgi:predicted GNAT family N-acyltransferase